MLFCVAVLMQTSSGTIFCKHSWPVTSVIICQQHTCILFFFVGVRLGFLKIKFFYFKIESDKAMHLFSGICAITACLALQMTNLNNNCCINYASQL